jgi:hypothetical protein
MCVFIFISTALTVTFAQSGGATLSGVVLDTNGGSVRLGDIDVLKNKQEVRRRLGYLPQEFGVYAGVSAEKCSIIWGSSKAFPTGRRVKIMLANCSGWSICPMIASAP